MASRTRKAGPWLALAALAAAAPASSEIVQNGPGRLRCGARPGMWDSRTITATAEGGRLAGSIHLVTPEPHPRWMPSAGFQFDAEGTGPAGLMVSLLPDDREHVSVILRMPDTRESMPIARFRVDAWVPISASIDEHGIFRITVGRQSAQHRVPAHVARRPFLMCSSGIFDFALAPGMQVSDEPYREH